MRFKYVCSDCGKEYITDKIMYQCPDCSKLNDGKSFPKGNLIVKLNKEVLKKAKEKEHVTPNDFYPYPSDGLEFPDDDTYEKYGQEFESKDDWRRNNVNIFISELYSKIKEIKSDIKSAS